MRTEYNFSQHKNEWILNKWFEKTFYIVGYVFTVLMALSFIAGFISGILE